MSTSGARSTADLELNLADDYGADRAGQTDSTARIQAWLNDMAAGGVAGYVPPGKYLHSDLIIPTVTVAQGIGMSLRGAGWSSQFVYTGTGTAVTCGSKTSGVAAAGYKIRDLRFTGSASAAGGLDFVGVQFSHFDGLRVDGFSGAGVKSFVFDTQSISPYVASVHNLVKGLYIPNATHGVQLTKDPADPGTDGSNFNSFWGLIVAAFTGIGLDVDAGEGNTFFHPDCSSVNDATTGIRINDDVTSLYTPRTDNSFGGGNTAVGIHLTTNARDHLIFLPTGNGPTTPVLMDDQTIAGVIIRHGWTRYVGEIPLSQVATGVGQEYAMTRAGGNAGSGANINANEIAYSDSTCGAGQFKRLDTTAGRRNLVVFTTQAAISGGIGQYALPGSVVLCKVDTSAVAVGDTIVASTTTAASGMTNNTVTDPGLIVGVARTAKSAGSAGTVEVYIR